MNTDAYSLSDSYVTVGGEGAVPQAVDDFAKKWVGQHYLAAFALLLVLTLVVLYLALVKCKEHFNPTQNLRDQDSDQFGLGRREHMDSNSPGATDRGKSAFAQQVQSSGGASFTVDPNAAPNQPGSLAWQVLHSSDFNCDKRQAVGDDAWAWMNGVARENMAGGNKPNNDNDFSRVLAGH